MFSVRTIILLGATIYLLPSDPVRQQQFVATATNAYESVITICNREPAMCEKAGAVFEDLKSKAHFGAGVVYALITGSGKSDEPAHQPAHDQNRSLSRWDASPQAVPAKPQGTLTNDDLVPQWRGTNRPVQTIRYN